MARQRAPTHPIETANRKSDDDFKRDYLEPSPSWSNEWTHPKTGATYSVQLLGPDFLSREDFRACFNLIEETSGEDYKASGSGWNPRHKTREMKSDDLRYILVKDENGDIRAFASLMPCFEEGEPVVYCYEIHLKPELRGCGLGRQLMNYLVTIAENLPPITKVMLTCFVSNVQALSFYRSLGFEKDAISPEPRTLRQGRVSEPKYIIMSREVRGVSQNGGI